MGAVPSQHCRRCDDRRDHHICRGSLVGGDLGPAFLLPILGEVCSLMLRSGRSEWFLIVSMFLLCRIVNYHFFILTTAGYCVMGELAGLFATNREDAFPGHRLLQNLVIVTELHRR